MGAENTHGLWLYMEGIHPLIQYGVLLWWVKTNQHVLHKKLAGLANHYWCFYQYSIADQKVLLPLNLAIKLEAKEAVNHLPILITGLLPVTVENFKVYTWTRISRPKLYLLQTILCGH